MKQILCRILLLTVVIAAIFGLSSCKIFVEQEPSTYNFVVNKFERSVVYGSELDLSGLDIEVKTAGEVKHVAVTKDMVTSGGSTDSVGEHELVIEYDGMSWPLYYEVFYKIEHIVDGFVYDSQLVTSREDLMRIDKPTKEGYTFIGWDKEIPDVLTDNLRIEAMFADVVIPDFYATYGDTLADLTLPEAKEGHWEWKHDLSTPVGNAGTNTFTLIYTPNNTAAGKLEFQVPVVVAKKKVEITVLKDKYQYDGNQHAIEYVLSDGLTAEKVNLICFGTEYATDIGSYYYNLRIFGNNYEGQVTGYLEISPIDLNVSITLQSPTDLQYKDEVVIDYGNLFPEYKVTITDKDGNPYDLSKTALKVVTNKPVLLNAGYYDIMATLVDSTDDGVNDLKHYNITYNISHLTVNKIDFNPGDVKFVDNGTIYYGDLLSSIKFADHPNGEWLWDYDFAGGDTVGKAGKNTFRAIFVPNDSNYNTHEAYVVIDVNKQELEFVVDPASTNVDYDGKEHCLSYVVVDKNGKVMTGLTVTGNDKYILANQAPDENYPITLKILDDNYTASANNVFYLHINKLNPVTDFETPINVVWKDDLKLEQIALPSANYTWVISVGADTSIGAAGTYTFNVKFTPDDIINYNVIESKMTVIVSRASTEISGVESSYDEWTYDGSEKSLADIFGSLTTNTVIGYDRTVEYRLNGEKVEKLTDAGVYNIRIVVLETEQYAEAIFDVKVTIKRADTEVSNLGIAGWTYLEYDENKNAPYSTSNYGTVIYEYKLVNEDDSAYTTTVPTNAGNYKLRARIEGGEGYSWNASEPKYYDFTISKAVVAIPEIDSKPYTGHTLTADVAEHDLYEIKENGNLGGIDVGSYTVTLVLNDPSNYVWSKNDSDGETKLDFKITQADNSIEIFDGGTWTYGDTVKHTAVNATFGAETVAFTYYKDLGNGTRGDEVKVVTDAGDYIVVASIQDTPNYASASREVCFKVEKLKIDVPTLVETEYEYTSSRISAELKDIDTKYYSVTNNGGIGVNTYYVHFDLNNVNYMWEDGDENLRKSLEYSIVKSLVTVNEASISGWTYLQDANAPSATKDKTFGEIKYEYKLVGADDSAYTTNVPTEAGNYVLRASIVENANYDSISKTVEFAIDKASASINGVREDLIYTSDYNTRAYTIKDVTSSHRESTVAYSIKDSSGATVTEMKNAGTYKVTVSLAESANYYAAESIEVTVVINKFKVNLPELDSTSRVYNGSAFEPNVKTNAHASYFSYSYPTDAHKDAGSYAVQFTLKDSDNYEWNDATFEGSIPYEITKANAFISVITENNPYLVKNEDDTYTLTLTYSGTEYDIEALIGATRVGESDLVYSVSKVQNVAHSGKITLSVENSTNYVGTSVEVDVVINPADIASANIHFGNALTYTGIEQTQSISAVKLGDLDVTYTVSGSSDKATNAGNHTVTVIGTGNFIGKATATFTVLPKNIAGAVINLGTALTYNGREQYQTVSSVDLTGFEGVTYIVSENEAVYAVDASDAVITYTLTVTGTGNFTGTETKTFTVAKRDITGATVNLGTALIYTGKEQYQTVSSVMLGDLAATYTVANNEATYVVDEFGNERTYTLTVIGTGNFVGTATADFAVAPKNIVGATVNLGTALTYNGKEQSQTVSSVTIAGFSDITYTVSNNKATYAVDESGNERVYNLTVTGTGNFTGTATKSFKVNKYEIVKPEDNRQIKWTGEHLTSGIKGNDFFSVEDVGGIDEDDYKATLTITDINCKWKGEADETLVIEINYSIAKEINHWSETPFISKDLWIWNEESAIVNKGAAEQGDVTYKFAPEGTTDYTTDMPTKPGKYVVVFTATAEGYKDLVKTVPFEIEKITLTAPEFIDNALDYANGAAPELVLKENADSDKFTFTNNVETNVGHYSIEFTIKTEYKDYYKWNDSDPESFSVDYSIERVDEEITNLEIDGWTYGEYDEDVNAPSSDKKFTDSEVIYEYKLAIEDETKYTRTVPTVVGDYVVRARIEGGEGYNWNGTYATATFSITAADASISIETEGKDYLVENEDGTYTITLTYTGEQFDLVSLIGATRVGEADLVYSVSKVQNVADSGKVTLSVANSKNYNGTSVEVDVVINPADIAGATVNLGAALTYSGIEQYQAVASVVIGDLNATYNVTGNAATYVVDEYGNVITYTLTVTGTGNFTGTETKTFTVLPKNIAGATVTLGSDLTYNGREQTQTVSSVTLAGFGNVTYSVTDDSDITVMNVNDYAITVTGTGNFTGTASATFSVAPLNISGATVILGLGAAPVYSGVEQTQTLDSVTVNGITLSVSDYDVVEGSTLTAKVVGDYSITIEGKGNFTGFAIKDWSIETKYLDMPYYDTVTKYTYDGVTEHVFFSETNTFWEATGDLSGVLAGDYYVTIVIKSEHQGNCEWKENVSREYKYTVGKGTNEFVGTLTMSGWTYEDAVIGEPSGITGAKFGFENVVYKYYDSDGNLLEAAPTSISSVGTYTVYAYIPGDGNNYDDITTEYKVEFKISPKEITAPKINLTQNHVKDGDNYPTILGTTDVLVAGDHGDYTVTYNNFPETLGLGTYYINVTLNNTNYVWDDTKDDRVYLLQYTLKGENAIIEVEDSDGVIDGWTYGEAPEDIIEYVKDKLGLKVSISTGLVTDYEMSILYFKSNTDNSATGSTVMPTDAGTYYFKIVIETDNDRYERTVGESFYEFTIASAPLTAPTTMTGLPATFGDTLGDLTITDKVYYGAEEISGTWTWDAGNDTPVGAVGTRTFIATFMPDAKYGTNYAPIENVAVTVTVSAKQIFLANTNNITSKPYSINGYTLSNIFKFEFSADGKNISLTLGTDYTVTIDNESGETVSSFTNVGVYKATVTLTNANYTLSSDSKVEYTFSVTKASLNLVGAVENNSSKPYGGDYHNWTADNFKGGLSLTDASGTTVTGLTINVGIYSDAECTVSIDSITNVKSYYIKYTLAENDNYVMTDVVRVVKVIPADPGVSAWPIYTGSNYKNLINKTSISNTGSATVSGVFTLSDPTFSGGYAVFTITFTPDDENYAQVHYENYQVALVPVARYGATEYYTIKDALDVANESGGNVWVYPDVTGNVIIDTNIRIANGVTLILPYGKYTGTDDATVRNQSAVSTFVSNGSTLSNASPETYRMTLVKLLDGKTITIDNGGILEISGELAGKSSGNEYAGHTAGMYAELMLGDGAVIDCSGNIKAYGFITEEHKNGGSKIEIKNGAVLNQPFTLLDFRGGSYMYATHSDGERYNIAPFEEFIFMNVESTITYHFGGKLEAWANLFAGEKHNHTLSYVIGNSSKYCLQMPSGGSITSKYDKDTMITDLDIYGGISINAMSLTINTGIPLIGNVPISTDPVYFPVSWAYDISLNRTESQRESNEIAIFTVNQKIQLLPGSKLVVEEGARLDVKDVLHIHDRYVTNLNSVQSYGDGSAISQIPAMLLVRGELVAHTLAGRVHSDVDGAKVTITNGVKSDVYRVDSVEGSSLFANATISLRYTLTASFAYMDENGNVLYVTDRTKVTSGGSYMYTHNGNWRHPDAISISYNSNGGNNPNTTTSAIYDPSTGRYALISDATRDHYIFNGWYNGDVRIDDGILHAPTSNEITLEAHWTAVEYTVKYEYWYQSEDSALGADGMQAVTYTYTMDEYTNGQITLTPPENGTKVFAGWYNNSACATENQIILKNLLTLNDLSSNRYSTLQEDGTHLIHCLYSDVAYTVIYQDDAGNEIGRAIVAKISASQYQWQMFEDQYLDNIYSDKYVDYWNYNGQRVETFGNIEIGSNTEFVVTATFATKAYTVNVSVNNGLSGNSTINHSATIYLTEDQLNNSALDEFTEIAASKNRDTSTSKYFAGWSTTLALESFGDSNTLSISATWADKMVLNLVYGSYGNNTLGFADTVWYLSPDGNDVIPVEDVDVYNFLGADNAGKDYAKYFSNWHITNLIFSYDAASNTALVNYNGLDGSAATATPEWNDKIGITINHYIDGEFDRSETVYVNFNVTERSYDSRFDVNNLVTSEKHYFAGWSNEVDLTFSGNIINLAPKYDGGIMQQPVPSISANWETKYKLTISSGSNSDFSINETLWLMDSQLNNSYLTAYETAGQDNYVKKNDHNVDKDKYFGGWSSEVKAENFNANKELTVTAQWAAKQTVTVTITKTTNGNTSDDTKVSYVVTFSDTNGGESARQVEEQFENATKTYYVLDGYKFVFSDVVGKDSKLPTSAVTVEGGKSYSYTINSEDGTKSCVAAGTLITLADGTVKAVEDLLETDILLVYDHVIGEYVPSSIIFIERDGWKYYNVIYLEYSNGVINKLIGEHAMFDLTLNTYVYITEENYLDFVGHEFAYFNGECIESVTLESAYVNNEYTGCFSLVTAVHLNYFIDGMFSIPGGIEGIFNIFEYGEDLKFDAEKMQADIETYGLFTYEDFAEYVPEEVFYAFQAQYFKVSIGKGYITFDEILAMIDKYLVKNGVIE